MTTLRDLLYSSKYVPDELSEKVKTHVPIVEMPEQVKVNEVFKVRIRINHPLRHDHSIRRVMIYFIEDGKNLPVQIASINLEAPYAEPEIELSMKFEKGGSIIIVSYCNLHGLWEEVKRIQVIA